MNFSNDELDALHMKIALKPPHETCSPEWELIRWLIADLRNERERNARLKADKG